MPVLHLVQDAPRVRDPLVLPQRLRKDLNLLPIRTIHDCAQLLLRRVRVDDGVLPLDALLRLVPVLHLHCLVILHNLEEPGDDEQQSLARYLVIGR